MDVMWILSVAAIIALAVVFTRVLTALIKIVLLALILYFVLTRVDFRSLKKNFEHWTKPYTRSISWPALPHPGSKVESAAL